MTVERRKYKRFSATAFLKMPVKLAPCPPFFGSMLKGQLIDLSAGGVALLINEIIPLNTRLSLTIKFPDQTLLDTKVQVRRVVPKGKKFMLGFEFQTITEEMQKRIDQMSSEYIDCESRIKAREPEICRRECAFFTLCDKPQKHGHVFNVDRALEMAFSQLRDLTPAANPAQ